MDKMFESRQNGQDICGDGRDMGQIYQHLRNKDINELTDELAVLTADAANGKGDLELINAYLNVLDEKDPLPFEIDPEESLADFHEKHGLLLEQATSAPRRRRPRSPRLLTKVAAAFAAVLVCGSMLTQACGVNIWGMIARLTSETFRLEEAETPYAEVTVYPIAQGESATYDSLQDAVSAFGITDPLAPSWVPERFGSPEVYVEHKASGIYIYADYETEEDSLSIRFNESSRATQRTVEKDSSPDTSHIRRNITHYIVADKSLLKVTWNNGVFECHMSGSITDEEAREIIDSIYEERD